jgi:hypothetical protein
MEAGMSSFIFIQSRDRFGNVRDSGGDTFEAMMTSTSHSQPRRTLYGSVRDDSNGSYLVIFDPTIAGPYDLHIRLRGSEVAGSPFRTIVEAGATSTAHSEATGSGLLGCVVGSAASFDIVTKDAFNNRREKGGDTVRVFTQSMDNANSRAVFGVVRDLSNGVYRCSYTVETPGTHRLVVKINGVNIAGSPFTISAVSTGRFVNELSTSQVLRTMPADPVVKLQAVFRGFLARKRFREILHGSRLRAKAATEIVNTEATYLKRLHLLKDVYVSPLRAAIGTPHPILNSEKIGLIFGNLDYLIQVNTELFGKLQLRLAAGYSPTVILGDIFVEFSPIIQYTYSQYVNNFDQAVRVLALCQEQDQNFAAFLDAAKDHPTEGYLSLNALLIEPVQRLPRYALLLKELLKYTPPDHKDHHHLTNALDKIRAVTDFVNENKRKAENMQRVIDVQNSIDVKLRVTRQNKKGRRFNCSPFFSLKKAVSFAKEIAG